MSPARKDIKKDESTLIDFGAAASMPDPAVSALLGQAERRQSEARLPQKAREKKKKEREKIRARRPYHTTYDIPVELRRRIKELAEAQGIPASQLATLGLLRLVEDLAARQVDLTVLKAPSRSPRYDFNLVIHVEDYPATFAAGKRKR
jgi:hypothetical protein